MGIPQLIFLPVGCASGTHQRRALHRYIDWLAMLGPSDKVSIKRVDRLLCNTNQQRELPLFYKAMTWSIVNSKSQSPILIDLSNADTAKQRFILRACIAAYRSNTGFLTLIRLHWNWAVSAYNQYR